jgi:hypothetical protein
MKKEIFFYEDAKNATIGPITKEVLFELAEKNKITESTNIGWEGVPTWIKFRDVNAKYHVFCSGNGQFFSFYTEHDLNSEIQEGMMGDFSITDKIYSYQVGLKGVTIKDFLKSDITITPDIKELISQRNDKPLTILSGANNTGKTYVLKRLRYFLGETSLILLPNRFNELRSIPFNKFSEEQRAQDYGQYMQQFLSSNKNDDTNRMQLDRVFGSLTREKQDDLIEILESLLGDKFAIKQRNPEMRGGEWFIEMNDTDFNYSSTGTRLLLTLLANCMRPDYDTILIDEPELGLSPKLQKIIFNVFSNQELRTQYFPHLKSIWITTHSHVFLDKSDFSNNLIVSKNQNQITVTPVQNINEFNELQFDLLGNDIEELFLPSLIVLVEGISDAQYLKKVVRLKFPNTKITIVNVNGDGQMLDKIRFLDDTFGGIYKSPYNGKIIVVLDKTISVKEDKIVEKGIPKEHIVRWEENGIEFYYPADTLKEIFSYGDDDIYSKLEFDGPTVELNGITKKKTDLALEVLNELSDKSVYPQEMEEKLFKTISAILDELS